MSDISQAGGVGDAEVAGVDAAVVFDDEVGAAGGGHGAEGGLSRDQAVEDGVEEADGDGLGVVGIPGVEEPAEEFAPFSGFEGMGESVAVGGSVGAFDVLVEGDAQRLEVVVDVLGMVLVGFGDEGEDVVFNVMALEGLETAQGEVVAAGAVGVASAGVMEGRGAVEAESDEELLALEEVGPAVVEEGSVGLKGVADDGAAWAVEALESDGLLEEGQFHEGGFAALPAEEMLGHGDGEVGFRDGRQGVVGHPVGRWAEESLLGQVEAVAAAEVAVEGGWLDENRKRFCHCYIHKIHRIIKKGKSTKYAK